MINLNWQRDDQWHWEIMTQANVLTDPLKRQWKDRLGDYGCLVTSISNILIMTGSKDMTPKLLNQKIIENKGYNYLTNPNCPEAKASIINWACIEKLYPMFIYEYRVQNYSESNRSFHIAEVKLDDGEHHINVMKKIDDTKYVCFDVWDCRTKVYDKTEILSFHRMTIK